MVSYAGSFLDHRAQDGLSDTLYYWANTPDGRDTILNWDQETSGAVYEHDGSVYWIANGWQCLPVYRVTGWMAGSGQEIPIRVTAKAASAAVEGSGLRAATLQSRPHRSTAIERTDARVWFMQRNWYGHADGGLDRRAKGTRSQDGLLRELGRRSRSTSDRGVHIQRHGARPQPVVGEWSADHSRLERRFGIADIKAA